MVFGKVLLGTFAIALAFVSGCGGGGGGAAPAAATTTALDSVATLTYKAKSKPAMTYTLWELIELEPVVTVSIGTATRTFTASPALPPGITLDSNTGLISGRAADLRGNISVRMTASGYSRDIATVATIEIAGGLTEMGSCRAGFALVGVSSSRGWACIGNTGIAGTINFAALYHAGGLIGSPFPAGTTIVYSLISSTAPGATIDPSTGIISLTPAAAGTFRVQWAADVTNGGITVRYTGSGVTLTVV